MTKARNTSVSQSEALTTVVQHCVPEVTDTKHMGCKLHTTTPLHCGHQENVKAVLRRQMRHVLYTEPEVVTAGKRVTLHYNPADTPLAGQQSIFLSAGFNRWAHARKVGPVELSPPQPGHTHWQVGSGHHKV